MASSSDSHDDAVPPDASAPGDDASADGASADGASAGGDGAAGRAWTGRLLRGLGWSAGAVVLLLAALLLVLQTDWGATVAARWVAQQANPFVGTTLHVGSASGSWVGGLELRDVTLTRPGRPASSAADRPSDVRPAGFSPADTAGARAGGTAAGDASVGDAAVGDAAVGDTAAARPLQMAGVDTVSVTYDLWALMQGVLHVRSLRVAGLGVTLRQQADTTWDWQQVLPAASADTSSGGFAIRLDRLDVTRSTMTAHYHAPGRDSTTRLTGGRLALRDLRYGDAALDTAAALGATARLDTLGASVIPAGASTPRRLFARARLAPDRFVLDTLRLASPASDVRGHGTLRLPTGAARTYDDVDFAVSGAPLALRDVQAFAPFAPLNPDASAQFDLRVTGSDRLLEVSAGAALTPGGTVSLNGAATPVAPADAGPDRPLQYRLDAQARDLNTAFLAAPSGSPADAPRLNGALRVDLVGPALSALDGYALARVDSARYGAYALDRSRLTARFTEGQARLEADAAAHGARMAMQGQLRPFDDRPSYDLAGAFEGVDLSRLPAGSGPPTALQGSLSVRGAGLAPASAALSSRMTLASSTVGAQPVDRATLTATLDTGTVDYAASATLPDGGMEADGTLTWGTPLRYTLDTARFDRFNAAAFVGDTTASRVTGTLQAAGRGTTPSALQARVEARIAAAHYGSYRLGRTRLQAAIDDRRLATTLDATLGRSPSPADTAAGRGAALASSVSPADDTSAAALLDGFGSRGADSLALATRAASDSLRAPDVSASPDTSAAGRITLALTARPFAPTPAADITEGRFRDVDVGALLGTANPSSALTGTFTGTAQGASLDALQADGQLQLAPSRVNAQRIEAATATLAVQDGALRYDATLTTPAGESRLAGTARPWADTPTYAVTEGRLGALNVGALAGQPAFQTRLNGSFQLEGAGLTPATLVADGRLDLGRSVINRDTLEAGTLTGRFANESGQFDGTLAFDRGRVQMEGTARQDRDTLRYQARGDVDALDVGALLGADSVATGISGGFRVEGAGTDPRTLALDGRVTAGPSRYGALTLDTLDVRWRAQGGLFTVDTLQMRSNVLVAQGAGRIAPYALEDRDTTSNFRITAAVRSTQPLRPFLGAASPEIIGGRIEGRLYGQAGTPRFDATTTIGNVVYGNVRVADIEGRLAGEYRDGAFRALAGRGSFDYLSVPTATIEDTRFNGSYDGTSVTLDADLQLDRQRTAALSATLRPELDAQRVTLDAFNLTLDQDRWRLLRDAAFQYGDTYRVQQLLLYSGTQQIAVDGAVDFNGTQSLVATVENLQVGPIADLVGYRGLGGTLSGTVDLTGPATAPVLDSRLRFDVRSEGEAVGTMRLRAAYDSLDARLDGTLTHTEGSTLRLQGDVPVDLRLARPAPADLGSRPVRLDLEAEQFALDWVDPFVAPSLARDVRGALTARATMRGTRAQPDLEGRLTLRDGRLMVPRLGLTYREIDADALLDEDEVRLTRATMASTSGSAQAEGVISLADLTLGEYDLSIRATNFTAIDTREYEARVDSDLSLRGTTRRPALSGDLTVETGEVIYTADSESELASVQLSERDQQVLEQRFGLRVTADDTTTFSYYEATAMDLNVEIERNTWLRSRANPKMDIQFSGNLNLAKEAMDAAQVFGTINVVTERSRIEQLGKVFQIEEGALTFNGPMGNPSMNIRAVYEPEARESQGSEVRIVLDVSGRPDDPRLDLSAEPPMETKDIISYVATGRPAENVGGGSGGFSGGAIATDLVFGQASSLLENFASAQLGLDVARVKVRPDGRSIIAAGQYLTPRFYTAVELPISRDARSQTALNVPDITLEYELTQWLLARVQRRNSALQLNFLIEYAY